MIRFNDGMSFDTSGPMRAVHRSDGWYVVGLGMLIPVDSKKEADDIVAEHVAARKSADEGAKS